MKIQILIILLLSFLSLNCEKDKNDTNNFRELQGTWINTVSDFDALIFKNEDLLERKNLQTGSNNHHYSINIESSEIILKYTGKDKIELESSKHKYYLNNSKDTLVIENLSQYYPNYDGDKFYKSKTE